MLGYQEFVEDIKALDGKSATFVSLVTDTVIKTTKKDRKTGEPVDGQIRKQCRVSALLNGSYENSVAKRDYSYEVGERQWGVAYQDGANPALIEKSGKLYLQIMHPEVHEKKIYSPDADIHKLKNMDIFPKKSGNSSPVTVRAYKLSSINYIKINGKEYDLTK